MTIQLTVAQARRIIAGYQQELDREARARGIKAFDLTSLPDDQQVARAREILGIFQRAGGDLSRLNLKG